MYDVFDGCSSLESVDVSNLVGNMVYDMDSMFEGCKSLKSVNFEKFRNT